MIDQLFKASIDSILIADAQGAITQVNPAAEKMLGYSKEELIGKHAKFLYAFDEEFESVSAIIKETGGFKGEIVNRTKSGKNITTFLSANFLFDDDGTVLGMMGISRDITKQKEIERKLIEREKTLHQITETLSDVFYLYNIVEGKYEYISSNCENVLGATQDFFYSGKSHTKEFGYVDDKEILYDSKDKVDAGEPYDIDYRIVVNGEIKWVNEKSFPIKDDSGQIIANSGICRDVTNLRNANETIYRQNIEIGASILYAKRLQDSVLPSTEKVKEIFPDSFVLYRPKDVVSGDFYVVDNIQGSENIDLPTFIVGDCTGHGIPGAVLSLMCNVLIRESFTRKELYTPGDALGFVRERLSKFFEADNEVRIRDGMDVAFCIFHKPTMTVHFSGGYNSCVVMRDDKIIEYKGDKQHVGYTDNPKPFVDHAFKVEKGDMIFLYTDGYMDQFGGSNARKYTKKRLHKSLLALRHLPMEEIGHILGNEFINWKLEEDQTDDVTIFGVRI